MAQNVIDLATSPSPDKEVIKPVAMGATPVGKPLMPTEAHWPSASVIIRSALQSPSLFTKQPVFEVSKLHLEWDPGHA